MEDLSGGKNWKRSVRLGPGLLVTAAFIGPGTVVTASKAGANRGCGLLWTILFACFGTIVLQSLAARVGILRGTGLGESIRERLKDSRWLGPAILLVVSAIGIGNAAYQTGNLTGAVAGINAIVGGSRIIWIVTLLICTSMIISLGQFRVLHGILVGLVTLLSVAFLFAAVVSLPSMDRIASGMLIPSFQTSDLTLVIALIGTTIVPYNLFLHCSGAASTWAEEPRGSAIAQSDRDTFFSISLGGLVTASIMVTSCTAFFDTNTAWTSTDDIARQLEPTLGASSSVAYAIGLFAAGLTSSITAPVATAYAVCGCLGWSTRPSDTRFRCIAIAVVVVGATAAIVFGKSPSATILFAQLANGILLPIAAVFLLLVSGYHQSTETKFGKVRMILAVLVVASVSALGIWRIISALT